MDRNTEKNCLRLALPLVTKVSLSATCLASIPASRLDPVVDEDALLLWVRDGSLTVRLDSGERFDARAGQAVWIPPALRHSAETTPGSVVLPVLAEAAEVPDALDRPCVVAVPSSWQDWLMYRVARWFGFSSGAKPDGRRLFDLLAGAERVRGESDAPLLPTMPRSPGARAVVERLLDDPACEADLVELAAEAVVSPRTLQRQLKEETGHGLAQWRTLIRLDAAARLLVRGRDLGWVAHRVGYASVSGFAHAFAEHMGQSPGRFAAGHRRSRPVARASTGGARRGGALVAVAVPPAVPDVPPSGWVTPFDSVLWMYRGSARVEAAGTISRLEAGDVIWLPQGVAHRVEFAPGAILLPLGYRPTARPGRIEPPRVVELPRTPEMETFLLHAVVANHFLLRPRDHDPQALLSRLQVIPPDSVPLPEQLEVIVVTVQEDPSDPRGLVDWAAELGVDAGALGREFAEMMGESFPRWRSRARMTRARALMWDGHAPSSVARRVGYAHLSAFSKAFSATHGIPPREWLRRDAG